MENEILDGIVKDVDEQVELVVNQIDYEIKQMHEEQLSIFKEGLKKEQESYLDKELDDLQMLTVTKSSKAKLKTKRDLLSLREELVNELFKDLAAKLQAYCKTAEYKTMIEKTLGKLKADQGELVVDENDKVLYESFIKEHKDVVLKVVKYRFGGFKYVDTKDNVEYDYTLDTRFDEQTEWFKDHSGLTI